MKKGEEYELLIEQIYRDLQADAKIKQNDSIWDHQAQIFRQIDLSIRYKIAEIDFLIIVQAKDTTRKADVNVVGEFMTVVQDIRADRGILICQAGFTGPAIKSANNKKIQLYSAHGALQKRWALELNIPAVKYEDVFDFSSQIGIDIDKQVEKLELSLAGKMFRINETEYALNEIISMALKNRSLDKTGTEITIDFNISKVDYFYKEHWFKMTKLAFSYKFKRREISVGTFTPTEYRALRDYSKDKIIHTYISLDSLPALITDPTAWKTIKYRSLPIDLNSLHVKILSNNVRLAYSFNCVLINPNK